MGRRPRTAKPQRCRYVLIEECALNDKGIPNMIYGRFLGHSGAGPRRNSEQQAEPVAGLEMKETPSGPQFYLCLSICVYLCIHI